VLDNCALALPSKAGAVKLTLVTVQSSLKPLALRWLFSASPRRFQIFETSALRSFRLP
jgi:hypothetical protein